ncbi:hypothetical protein GJAV_G00148530 [Gymnothorax javanicus]|nr:hypothetical protein GJAV_G00148530 [Gymnothorax javanicus]
MKCFFQQVTLILLCIHLQTGHATTREFIRGRGRVKRQQCPDGYGDYNGRQCCRCPLGYYLDTCHENGERDCLHCEPGSYTDHANLEKSCEPCKSCDPKANLEIEDKCTELRNTVCRCQEGYFCNRGVRECNACHSCKKCEDNFVVDKACTATNDTICKKKEAGPWWIIFLVIGIIAIIVFCILKKQGYCCFGGQRKKSDMGQDVEAECVPLQGINLDPHLSYIANQIGPKLAKKLVRPDLDDGKIECHEENARNDAMEQTYLILKDWCELKGLENAAPSLIKRLHELGRKKTADEIKKKIEPKKE